MDTHGGIVGLLRTNVMDVEEGIEKNMHPSTSALTNEALGTKLCPNVEKNESNKKTSHYNIVPNKSSRAMKASVFNVKKLCPKELQRRFGFEDLFQSFSFVDVACLGDIEIIVNEKMKLNLDRRMVDVCFNSCIDILLKDGRTYNLC